MKLKKKNKTSKATKSKLSKKAKRKVTPKIKAKDKVQAKTKAKTPVKTKVKSQTVSVPRHVNIAKEDDRDAVLFARIKPENITYLQVEAKAKDMSLSKYVDKVVDQLRA